MLRLGPDEKIGEQNSIIPNSSLTLPLTIIKKPTKSYVDRRLKDPSIIRNTVLVDFDDKNPDNVRFVKVNSMPTIGEHLAEKKYVDHAIYQSVHHTSLLRLDPCEQLKIDDQDSKFTNSKIHSPKTILELPTKKYVDSLHEISRISTRFICGI